MATAEKLVERSIYVEEIKGFFDTEPVKVIQGVRRSGKSDILKLVVREALKHTDEDHVIFINFESSDYDDIISYKELNKYVENKMKDGKRYYIFLDEIQNVKNWEKAVNSLRLKNTDIYITGSNSELLSGEMSTLLGARCVTFHVSPLSFAEFRLFRKEFGIGSDTIDDYIRIGGFPLLSTMAFTDAQARMILTDVHSTSVLKDVVKRNGVKNVSLLERVIAFIYDNVGRQVSVKKLVDYLRSSGNGANFDTVSNYIGYLETACIIRKAPRYDIKGKKLLEINEKYFLADHSLQYVLREMRTTNLPGILENIVFNDLVRRGYKVYVGKLDSKEIDFIAERINGSEKIYVQVCTEFTSEGTIEREFSPLKEIKDHHSKYVVTLDKYWKENVDGVVGIHLQDFLLRESL
jgi:predicted AAA+ superfamily ATPase